MSDIGFSSRKLGIACLAGVGLLIPLLAFGLWASLGFATITTNQRLYWALNWVYLVLGLGLGLVIVRWHTARVRWLAAGALLLVAALIGLVKQ